MPEPLNDIDSLLRYLLTSGHTQHWNDDSTRWRAAITALVAERNALKERVAELKRDVDMWREDAHKWKEMYNRHYESERIWISRCEELKQRVAELEKELKSRNEAYEELRWRSVEKSWSQPPPDRDRDLRERLVCAIWPQMLRSFDQPSDDGSRYEWQALKAKARNEALDEADKMLDFMRKQGGGA